MLRLLKSVRPLDRYTHSFMAFVLPITFNTAEADIIIMDANDSSDLESLVRRINRHAHIIALSSTENVRSISSILAPKDDVWHDKMSREEIIFRFQKMLKLISEENEHRINEYYLEAAINSVPDLVWFKDKDGAHTRVNNSFCKAVGKSHEQINGRGHYYIWDIEPEEYAKGEFICMESEYEVMEKKKTCVFDEKVLIANDMRELKTYKSPLFDFDGSVMGTVGIARDVTIENQYRHKMINNANRDFLTGLYNRRYIYNYIEQLKGTPYTLFYIDLDHFKKVNDMYGHAEGDRALVTTKTILEETMRDSCIARVGGDEFMIVLSGEMTKFDIDKLANELQDNLKTAYAADSVFTVLSASIGTYYVAANSSIPLDNIIMEADERMYKQKKIAHGHESSRDVSTKDTVTGLPRYEEFITELTNKIEYIDNQRVAVIYGDIKHFKYINDTYGYHKGNELLSDISRNFQEFEGNYISATRLYSDNFVIALLVSEDVSNEEFRNMVSRWGMKTEQELGLSYATKKLRFVAGITIVDKENHMDAETAVSNANIARKEAKRKKEDCIVLFNDHMLDDLKWEIEISASLPDAIRDRKLEAFYQPKIDSKTLSVIGGEALVRWKRDDGTYLAPDNFIPILEKTGQIVDVDYYIYREVFSFIDKRLKEGKKVVPISMNVSRIHLLNDEMIKYVESLFTEFPIPREYIEFELTESIYIRNSEEAIRLVNNLHNLGIRVSMDDFGTGYSSLNLLGTLPIDTIKLDRAFLQRDNFSKNDKIILSNVINMSKQLQMKSLCEGVENETQIEYLKEAGCDEQQGYYFSKPIPKDKFEEFLSNNK